MSALTDLKMIVHNSWVSAIRGSQTYAEQVERMEAVREYVDSLKENDEMIITPARFEDMMLAVDSIGDGVQVMLDTLDSLGYGTGVNLYRSMFEDSDDN